MIITRMEAGQYRTISDCLDDLNLMFENAMKYNISESQIYQDSVKLQALAHKESRILLEDLNDDTAIPDVLESGTANAKRKAITPYKLFTNLLSCQSDSASKGIKSKHLNQLITDQWKLLLDSKNKIFEEKCNDLSK